MKRADKKREEIREKNAAAAHALGIDLDSFGNPDELIDALGAQRTLEVVDEDGRPVDSRQVDWLDYEEAGIAAAGGRIAKNADESTFDSAEMDAAATGAFALEALESLELEISGKDASVSDEASPRLGVAGAMASKLRKRPKHAEEGAWDPDEVGTAKERKRPSVHDEWERERAKEAAEMAAASVAAHDEVPAKRPGADEAFGAERVDGGEAPPTEGGIPEAARTDASEEIPDESTVAKKLRKRQKPWTPGRIAGIIVFALLLIIVLVIAAFAWDRWLRFDDAADLQGTWYAPGGTAPVTITEDTIVLNDEVSYPYTLDTTSKTIHYVFKNTDGVAHYRFSSNGGVLVLVEGGDPTWMSTLVEDLAVMHANLGAADEEVFALEGEDPLVLYESELAAESAYQTAQIKASREAQSQARENQAAAIAEKKAEDLADAEARDKGRIMGRVAAAELKDMAEEIEVRLRSIRALGIEAYKRPPVGVANPLPEDEGGEGSEEAAAGVEDGTASGGESAPAPENAEGGEGAPESAPEYAPGA